MLACGLACYAESFEKLGKGALTTAQVEYGSLSADAGHAEIHGKGRSGEKSLRIMGGAGHYPRRCRGGAEHGQGGDG